MQKYISSIRESVYYNVFVKLIVDLIVKPSVYTKYQWHLDMYIPGHVRRKLDS